MKNKQKHDWSKYNSIESIQEFINQNNIRSYSEFRETFSGLRGHINKNKICIPAKDLIFPDSKKQEYWRDLNTLTDIQNFIDINKIQTSRDLLKKFPGLYRKVTRIGLNIKDLFFKNVHRPETKWKNYENLSDFQNFINNTGIRTVQEFKKSYSGLERRLRRRGFSTSQLIFPERNRSSLEIMIEKFLLQNNINFMDQYRFDDLKKYPFDFYLPEFNLVLEPGGDQHFIEIENWKGKDELIKTLKRDKLKYEYCIKNNITILYYFKFSNKSVYNILSSNGYMGEWFTNFDLFTNRILEIIGRL